MFFLGSFIFNPPRRKDSRRVPYATAERHTRIVYPSDKLSNCVARYIPHASAYGLGLGVLSTPEGTLEGTPESTSKGTPKGTPDGGQPRPVGLGASVA